MNPGPNPPRHHQPPLSCSVTSSTSTSTSTSAARSKRPRGHRPKSLPFALAPAVAAVSCDPNNQIIFQEHAAVPVAPSGADARRESEVSSTASCLPCPRSSTEPALAPSPPSPVPPPTPDPLSPRLTPPNTTNTRPIHPFFQQRRKPDPLTSNANVNSTAPTAAYNDVVDLTSDQSGPISLPSPPPPPPQPIHPFFSRPGTAPVPDPRPKLRRSTRRRRPTQSAVDQAADLDPDPATATSSSPKRKRARTSSSSKQRKPLAHKHQSDTDEWMSDDDLEVLSETCSEQTDPQVLEQARILALIQARKRSDDLMRRFYKPPVTTTTGPAGSVSGDAASGGFFAPKHRKHKVEVVVVDASGDGEVDVVGEEGRPVDRFNHPIRNVVAGSKVKVIPAPWPSCENMHVGRALRSQPASAHPHRFPARTCATKIDSMHIPPWLLRDLGPSPLPTLAASSTPDRPPAPTHDTLLWTDKYAPQSIRDLCDSHLRHAGRQILAWLQEQLDTSGTQCVGAPKRVRDRVLGKRKAGNSDLDGFVVEDSDAESEIEEHEDEDDVDVVGLGSDREEQEHADEKEEEEGEEHAFPEHDPSDDDDFIGPSSSTRRRRDPRAPRRAKPPALTSKPRYGPGALLLTGPPGAGKSALLYALCAQLSLTLFEVHPGHRRAAKDIEHLLGQVADTHTVRAPIGTGGVLVVDAANVVFDEDKSMWQGVASVAVKTRRPLVIVVDDGCEEQVPKDLVHVGLRVRVERPGVEPVVRRVGAVLRRERPAVEWADEAIRRTVVARGATGGRADLRAALMQVQFESARPAVHDATNVTQAIQTNRQDDLDELIQQLDMRAACDMLESAVGRAIPYQSQPELPPAAHPDSMAVDLEMTWLVPSCVMFHQAALAVDKTVEWIRHLLLRNSEAFADVRVVLDPPALVKAMHAWAGCQRSGAPTVTPTSMRLDLVPAIAQLARLDLMSMDEADMAMAAAASGGARRTRRRMYRPAVRLEGINREELEEIVAHRSVFCVIDGVHNHLGEDLEVGLLE